MLHGNLSLLFLVILWWIWRWRNNFALGDCSWKLTDVVCYITRMHTKITTYYHHHDPASIAGNVKGKWQPPRHGFVKINVDGSCSNSGVIESGGLVRDELGI